MLKKAAALIVVLIFIFTLCLQVSAANATPLLTGEVKNESFSRCAAGADDSLDDYWDKYDDYWDNFGDNFDEENEIPEEEIGFIIFAAITITVAPLLFFVFVILMIIFIILNSGEKKKISEYRRREINMQASPYYSGAQYASPSYADSAFDGKDVNYTPNPGQNNGASYYGNGENASFNETNGGETL